MRRSAALAGIVVGLLFGVGLAVSGMADPRKVIGFLDFAGDWDPSLLFVMGGAVGVHALAQLWIRRRRAPLLDERFSIPTRRDIDRRLLIGAVVFGLGWGLGGYCPGPAVVSLGAGSVTGLVFVATMALGMFGVAKAEKADDG